MIRIAVLGAGAHSSGNHGPALQRCRQERAEDIELTAVCDLDVDRAKKYAENFGFERVYTDLESMVAQEDLDGIAAVTPVPLTEEIAAQIMRLGMPLVVEKPPGDSLEEAQRLHDLAAALGAAHMVSFNRRFSPALTKARKWLAQHAKDRPPRLVISRMLRHERREEDFAFSTGIHLVDTALTIMGRPQKVVTHSCEVSAAKTLSFDARVTFADGGVASLILAPTSGTVEESIEIMGDDYDIKVDIGGCGVEIREGKERVLQWRAEDEAPEWEKNGALDETRAFIRYVETGEGWWPTMEEGLWSTRTAAAIQQGGEVLLGE